MANEIFKELKTRIALKTLSYAEWEAIKDTYKPLKGEMCICTIPAGNTEATNAPTVLFKIGDGTNFFSALKWASALAADVYDWAKVAGANVFTKDGAGNVVSGIEYDATLNGGKGGFKFTTASVATAQGLEELQKEVYGENGSAADSRIDKLENDIATNRAAWNKYEDTRYTFSNDGDKLVVKKTLYTNGVAGTEEAVGTYEFLTADEVAETLKGYYTKLDLEGKIHTEEEIKAMEIAHATAAGKVDTAITVKVGGADVVFDGSEAKTADVDAAIAAAIDAIPEVVHPEYSIVKGSTSDYAATYHLTKDGVNVGDAINIPKDMVVESGLVVENPEGQPEGTYIELKLQHVDEPLYINVGELIEYVTGGTTNDIKVTVDPSTHVVTAELTDGIQAIIGKGTEAYGWGNHANAGYATAESVAEITKDNGTIDSKITAYDESKNFGDIITRNANEFATSEQGGKADSALQEITTTANNGLKVTNKNNIDIDTDVVFVLDCNW